jgi:hypothetical protein
MSEIKKYIAVSQVDSGHASITYLAHELKNNADGTNEIEVTAKSKHAQLETYQVKSTVSTEQVKDLSAIGVDYGGMLRSTLLSEAEQGQEKHIYKKMKLLGYVSNRKLWTEIQNFAHKWTEYVPMVNISKKGSLLGRIDLLSNMIAVSSRMGRANFVIISPGLLRHFIGVEGFEPSDHDSSTHIGTIYKCGTYRGEIDILINPAIKWTDGRVVIGRSNLATNEGIFLVESSEGYNLSEIQSVDSPALMPMVETVLRSRYALVHTENASKNYITITCTEKNHNIITHIMSKYFKKKK